MKDEALYTRCLKKMNKAKVYKRAIAVRAFIVILLAAIVLVASAACNSQEAAEPEDSSRKAFEDDNNRIMLYVTAYGELINQLSDLDLLPEFRSVELVEEILNYGQTILSEDNLQALVNALNEMYPYTFSISRGHDRFDASTDNTAYVFFYFGVDDNGVYKEFNRLKLEGFLNDNTYPVFLFYEFRNGAWKLVDVEVYYADWANLTQTRIK